MKTIINSLIYTTAILLLGNQSVIAQAKKSTPIAKNATIVKVAHIVGKGKPYADKISLRWNTDNFKVFSNLVHGGVLIDRLIVGQDNKAEAGGWKRITTDTIKALTLNGFDSPGFKTDTPKIIVAQGLYGKSEFPKNVSLLEKVQLQDMEKQNRHLIVTLYSALSPSAAAAAGLAFDDKLITDTTKKYVYRIYPAKQMPGLARLDTGYIYVVGHDRVVKITYTGLSASGDDHRITLQWPKKTSPFSGYFIERSTDKIHFKPLNKEVFLPRTDTAATADMLMYTDSVANYVKYYYRLTGVNAFGERHQFAEIAAGLALDRKSPQVPELRFTRVKDQVTFTWKANTEKDLRGYYLLRGKGVKKMDTLANGEILAASSTRFQHTLPPDFSAGYYRLLAADTAGNISLSNAVYIFNPDTIPPAAPQGLTGSINKTGIVSLKWANDKTGDVLRGYKIFTSSDAKLTFDAVSGVIPDTAYSFPVTLKTLTKNVFVKIVAVDASFNHGKFSQVIKLNRPDTIAPPQPVIGGYTNTSKGIGFNWSKNPANDFSHFMVYRRLAGDTAWVNILQTRETTLTDSSVAVGNAYEYAVKAVDSTGLASNYSFPLHVKTAYNVKTFNIGLNGNYDSGKKQVTINWNKPGEPVKFYILYKDQGKGLTMYKSIAADKQTFTEDGNNAPNNQYAIKVVYANNAESEVYIFK